MEKKENVANIEELDFAKVCEIDVSGMVEQKNGLNYLSWAKAWKEFVKIYPGARYKVLKNNDNLPFFKSQEGYMVYTEVTVGELTHQMWLPVMDYRNKAILDANMFDINKTIMRCLTKNLAMFGLGIDIYTGEDLPDSEDVNRKPEKKIEKKPEKKVEKKPEVSREQMLKELPALLQQKEIDYFEKILKFFKLPENTTISELNDKQLQQVYKSLTKK